MLQKLQTKRGAFTLVEIMIVVAIIALLAAIAIPNFLRARKRSQASSIKNDLRLIDSAIDQYAIEANLKAADPVTWAQIKLYLKPTTNLYTSGNAVISTLVYSSMTFAVDAPMSTPTGTSTALGDVADQVFWSPFFLQ